VIENYKEAPYNLFVADSQHELDYSMSWISDGLKTRIGLRKKESSAQTSDGVAFDERGRTFNAAFQIRPQSLPQW